MYHPTCKRTGLGRIDQRFGYIWVWQITVSYSINLASLGLTFMGNSPFRQCLYDLKCKTQPDPLDQTTTFTEDPAFDSKIREAKTLIYEEILPGKKLRRILIFHDRMWDALAKKKVKRLQKLRGTIRQQCSAKPDAGAIRIECLVHISLCMWDESIAWGSIASIQPLDIAHCCPDKPNCKYLLRSRRRVC